jgi:hypothetical protein
MSDVGQNLRERNLTPIDEHYSKIIKISYLPFDQENPSALKKPEVINDLNRLHENLVIVPTDKARNTIAFVCKSYYFNCFCQ